MTRLGNPATLIVALVLAFVATACSRDAGSDEIFAEVESSAGRSSDGAHSVPLDAGSHRTGAVEASHADLTPADIDDLLQIYEFFLIQRDEAMLGDEVAFDALRDMAAPSLKGS